MSNYNPEVDSDEVCEWCEENEYELQEFDGEMLCPQCYWEAEDEALDTVLED